MPRRWPDRTVDEAKTILLRVFEDRPDGVFYERQLEVWFEDKFFHWITATALHELAQEGKIRTALVPLTGETRLRFYWSRTLRSWKREANKVVSMVRQYSDPTFAIAMGAQGETMFDAALPTVGFVPRARDVRAYGGHSTARLKNLDRVFERDGVLYGAEIKNTLDYIDRDEFEEKLLICKDLGLRPLFICRMLPKSYVQQVIRAGGFALIFKWQLYPHGRKEFAKEVHEKLGLPVDSPRVIEEGTLQRLVGGHEKIVGGLPPYNIDREWPEESEEVAGGVDDEGYLSEFDSDQY